MPMLWINSPALKILRSFIGTIMLSSLRIIPFHAKPNSWKNTVNAFSNLWCHSNRNHGWKEPLKFIYPNLLSQSRRLSPGLKRVSQVSLYLARSRKSPRGERFQLVWAAYSSAALLLQRERERDIFLLSNLNLSSHNLWPLSLII